jgi:hypothetical protein
VCEIIDLEIQSEPSLRANGKPQVRLPARGIQDYSVCTGGKIKVTGVHMPRRASYNHIRFIQ